MSSEPLKAEIRQSYACVHCHSGWWGVINVVVTGMRCKNCGKPLQLRGAPVLVRKI
jgi:DNA-directed RNA polymerase subunit RPC12/RpoP